MSYFLICVAGCSLTVAVRIPWRARYPLTLLRAAVTVLLLAATGIGVEVLRELRGLDALGHVTPKRSSRISSSSSPGTRAKQFSSS